MSSSKIARQTSSAVPNQTGTSTCTKILDILKICYNPSKVGAKRFYHKVMHHKMQTEMQTVMTWILCFLDGLVSIYLKFLQPSSPCKHVRVMNTPLHPTFI